MTRTRSALVALATIPLLALTACGGDDGSSDTTAPAATDAPSAPDETVSIEVDADSGDALGQTVALGTAVTIHVTTKTDQEFHLHGYDIEEEGTDVTFSFVADQAGEFELESHATETVVLTLTVTG